MPDTLLDTYNLQEIAFLTTTSSCSVRSVASRPRAFVSHNVTEFHATHSRQMDYHGSSNNSYPLLLYNNTHNPIPMLSDSITVTLTNGQHNGYRIVKPNFITNQSLNQAYT